MDGGTTVRALFTAPELQSPGTDADGASSMYIESLGRPSWEVMYPLQLKKI
jgi:hypothetical protein